MSDDTSSATVGSHPPFDSETGKRAVFVRERMRQWRKDNPDAPLTPREQKRLVREQILEAIPEVIDAMFVVASDPNHDDFGATSRALLDHAIGKAPASLELTGQDGGPMVHVYLPDNGRDAE